MELIKDLGTEKKLTKNGKGYNYTRFGLYRCKCGAEFKTRIADVNNGKSTQCKSCRSKKAGYKHGFANSKLYNTWRGMKERTTNVKSSSYQNYGGRGIKLCKEWYSFNGFKQWVDTTNYVDGLTIERIDVNGNYEPSNCCFITKKAQSYNKKNRISNKSRYTGVTWHSRDNIYEVSITFNYKQNYIGRFHDLKSAVQARNDFIDKNNLPHKKEQYIEEYNK